MTRYLVVLTRHNHFSWKIYARPHRYVLRIKLGVRVEHKTLRSKQEMCMNENNNRYRYKTAVINVFATNRNVILLWYWKKLQHSYRYFKNILFLKNNAVKKIYVTTNCDDQEPQLRKIFRFTPHRPLLSFTVTCQHPLTHDYRSLVLMTKKIN